MKSFTSALKIRSHDSFSFFSFRIVIMVYILYFLTCFLLILAGLVYVTPGGQAILNLVDFFGGGFIIFALGLFSHPTSFLFLE